MIPRTDWEILVHETLSELVTGITTLSLYQPDHPRSQTALDKLLLHLEVLLDEDGELSVVLLSDDLFVKGRPFTRLSRPAETFMRRMRRRRIEHVTFRRGVERPHLQAFLLDLGKVDDSPALSQQTILVGRVEFSEDGGGPDDDAGGKGTSRLGLVRDRVTLIAEAFKAIIGGRTPPFGDLDALSRHLLDEVQRGTGVLGLLSPWEGEERWHAVHAHNTCAVALALANYSEFAAPTCVEIGMAALLHDVGKLFWPAEVVQQELEVGGHELELILDHPREGLSLLLTWGHQVPPVALITCLEHHLYYNGGGYPRLPRPRRPQPASRLVAVADAFANLHIAAHERSRIPPDSAGSWLMKHSGTQFDPYWYRALRAIAPTA